MYEEDELPYDGDMSDDSQYCQHGTFIGSWWGPDYLCGECEMGDDFPRKDLSPDISDEDVQHTPIMRNYLEEDKPPRFCINCGNRMATGMFHQWCGACQTYFKYNDTDILDRLSESGKKDNYCPFCASVTHQENAHNYGNMWYMCTKTHIMLAPVK